jgi:signal transduction histidine kinase
MGAGRDLHGRRKDGSLIPLEIGLTSVPTAAGLSVLASVVDISARKQAEAERHQLEAQLRHAQRLEAIGALAGGIAHDFNNMLGAIVGYGELLRERLVAVDDQEDVEAILQAAFRGKELVERILRFSRREESRREALDLAAPVQEALQLLRSTLPAAVSLDLEVTADAPPVLADATMVHQVLLNLATNSAHAIAERVAAGGGDGRIDILLSRAYVRDSLVRRNPELREGWYAVMEVRDDGDGMAPEVLDRACEPFFTTKQDGGGTGLGLAMVRSLVRDHGGAVTIESEPGEGTRVRCYFPSAEVETEAETAAPADAAIRRGAGERVAFVDDQPALAEVGARRLRSLGYAAVAFTDAHAALAAVTGPEADFQLVVTDYSMPGFSGLELACAIRERRPRLPVVLLTGWLEGLDRQRLEELGVHGVLAKPTSLEALAGAVDAALAGRARRAT